MNHISYNQFFATIAGGSRLEILQFLMGSGAKSVSEIAEGTGQEQSAVSHNLKKLLVCSCVNMQVQGKNRYYSLNEATIVPILELADQHIQNFCDAGCCGCTTDSPTNSSRDLKVNKKGE